MNYMTLEDWLAPSPSIKDGKANFTFRNERRWGTTSHL